jgi:hypothetical protein
VGELLLALCCFVAGVLGWLMCSWHVRYLLHARAQRLDDVGCPLDASAVRDAAVAVKTGRPFLWLERDERPGGGR